MEPLRIALRNIMKRKKRASLTMLGVFIGIAAVVALISLGQGLQQTINAQFEKVGADKIMIQAKQIGFDDQNAPGQLGKRELNIIKDVNGVIRVSGVLFHAGRVNFNRIQRTLYIMSMPETPEEAALTYTFHNLEVENGRPLSHKDTGKALVGYNLANKNLFQKNVDTGDKITINDITFDVIGRLKRTGDPAMMDNSIIIPEANAREALNTTDGYAMIAAQTAKGENPEEIAERIEKTIRRDRHQKEGKEDFNVQTSTDLIESFNAVFNIIQVVFVGIAAISLFVGGIGIMNTMFTAVLERTREIGIMKAIGARNKDIMTIFMTESSILGLAGGILGSIFGLAISKIAQYAVNNIFGEGTLYAAIPPGIIIGVLLFSIFTGAISGILPARRAALLKPVEALRDE
ncbi:ABC transporter permease [Candidatus Woesearchaeota archaeon]|nr:ABC transporter permease [Candidatus Woesearchaeota archaeon]